jgi:cytochrome c-type biogenesis protein CcmH
VTARRAVRRAVSAIAVASVLAAAVATAPAAGRPVSEDEVHAVAAQLRCVVCQNLSVADSPSETARQMRELVRERLAAGDSREQVLGFFVERYGTWVLLAPPARGFSLLLWVLPFVALVLGLATAAAVARRWARASGEARAPVPEISDAMRARIRAELERPEAP